MRTFQFSDAKTHKFWNIEVKGKSLTVSFGKRGAVGQSQKKTFATPAIAKAEAQKRIDEKLKSGYTETTPKPVSPEEAAFETALRANPDDFASWCAYADYLAEQDDPRGAFMQTQIALEDESRSKKERTALKKKEAELLAAHEREWLGPLAEFTLDADPVTFFTHTGREGTRAPMGHTFTRGWLNRVEFHDLSVSQARALARAPAARLLREILVETTEYENPSNRKDQYVASYYAPGPDVPKNLDGSDEPGLHALSKFPYLGAVRVLQIGEGTPDLSGKQDDESDSHVSGEIAHEFVKQMPNLEELYLHAHGVNADKLFALPLPKLRALQLYHNRDYPLDKLAANKALTNLTTLLCHPHAVEYGDDAYIRLPQLRAICRAKHFKLAHLRLRLTDFGDEGAEEIVASGVLKHLKLLDLQGGSMTDEGAKVLAGSPDVKNLAFLNLNANALTKTGKELLKATGVKLNVSNQHRMESYDGDDDGTPDYLFDGDME